MRTHTHAHTHAHIHTHTHYALAEIYSHTQTNTPTYTHTYNLTVTHAGRFDFNFSIFFEKSFNLRGKKSVLATFVDFKKAYDQVWHARCLYKLRQTRFSGYPYEYTKYVLTGRSR